jgi:APA family basic amino acid/polyamine antiporter
VAVTAALAPITDVADLATVAALIALVMVCVAAMVLRYRNPNVRRAFRAPVLWFIAPAGVVCALYVVRSLPSLAREGLLVWLALGLVPYALYGYRHARRDQAE